MEPQTRMWSLIEALTNTVVSFVLAVIVQMLLFYTHGMPVSVATSVGWVSIFTAMSFVRGYFLRRFFNWLHHSREQRRRHSKEGM